MANQIININSDELVRFTNKLEKMSRYDLPLAVRGTLNELAFKMKGSKGGRGQIAIEAKREFDNTRQPNLFKVMTGVSKAKGFDMSSMFSESGIVSKPGKDKLAEGLAAQQEGGDIESKSSPTNESRTGSNISKKVKTANYMKRLVPVDISRNKGKRFMARASQAFKNDRAIIFKSRDGRFFVSRIKSIGRGKTEARAIDMKILFTLNKGRVHLKKARPFVNNAAKLVMQTLPREFQKQAEKRVKRAWEKK